MTPRKSGVKPGERGVEDEDKHGDTQRANQRGFAALSEVESEREAGDTE